jgi:hypothetical protein
MWRQVVQVGEQLPIPEGSNLEDDVKEIWRGEAGWHTAHWHGTARTDAAPPPGLDPYIQKLRTVLPQLSHLGIPSPLQVLKNGAYFYKDPQGFVQVRACRPCSESCVTITSFIVF